MKEYTAGEEISLPAVIRPVIEDAVRPAVKKSIAKMRRYYSKTSKPKK